MKKNIFICLAILSCTQVQAQNRWSLRQCIDYAIEHNIDIRRTANAAEQSNIEVNTAKWARLPNLNANAGQNWNWGRRLQSKTKIPVTTPLYTSILPAMEQICLFQPASRYLPDLKYPTNMPWPS